MDLFFRWFQRRKGPSLLAEQLVAGHEVLETQEKLVAIGPPAIKALLRSLDSPNDMAAWWIGETLKRIGEPALSRLIGVIPKGGPRRVPAIRALGQFDADAAPTIFLLVDLLNDPDPKVRSAACRTLGSIGPAVAVKIEAVFQACHDPDPSVVSAAIDALRETKADLARFVPFLTDCIGAKDLLVRQAAVRAIRTCGVDASDAVPALTRCVLDGGDIAKYGMEALAAIGPAGASALPALVQALSAEEHDLAAAETIWKVSGRLDLVLPAILSNLKTYEQGGSPEVACDLITEIGPTARATVPRLVDLLACEDYDTLWAAVDALGSIGTGAEPAIPGLIRHLDHPSGRVAGGSATALSKIGPVALPALNEALRHKGVRTREFAADALGRMGANAADAIPALLEIFQQRQRSEDRSWAIVAIAEIRPVDDPELLDALIALLETGSNGFLLFRAAGAIAKLGAGALPARDALKSLLSIEDQRVVHAAQQAIAAIEIGKK